MSDEHGNPETSHSNYTLSVVGGIGSMLLFALIIYIAYVGNRPDSVSAEIVQQRLENLAEVNAAQAKIANNYAWVNKEQGTVRIPLSQAMTLTAERLGKGEPAFEIITPTNAPAAKTNVNRAAPGPASKGGTVQASSGAASDSSGEEGTAATAPAEEAQASASSAPQANPPETEAGNPNEKNAKISTPISSEKQPAEGNQEASEGDADAKQ